MAVADAVGMAVMVVPMVVAVVVVGVPMVVIVVVRHALLMAQDGAVTQLRAPGVAVQRHKTRGSQAQGLG
jgi:hypothetical protein